MGDPVTTTLLLQAGSAVAGGAATYSQAQGQKQDAQINSYIGRTRAIQTNTASRAGLSDELASMRAVLAGNGQPMNVGTLELFNNLRSVRSSERRVEVGNRMQESRDYARAAKGYGKAAGWGLLGGIAQAAPYAYGVYDYRKKA